MIGVVVSNTSEHGTTTMKQQTDVSFRHSNGWAPDEVGEFIATRVDEQRHIRYA